MHEPLIISVSTGKHVLDTQLTTSLVVLIITLEAELNNSNLAGSAARHNMDIYDEELSVRDSYYAGPLLLL